MEIQLVIRAPNQNFDDQVIDCNDDWTVLRLKEHLSEVYPNKPIVKDQKLIYSGHLLGDNLQLKDVVRAADDVHIFHLVYNCKDPVLSVEQASKSRQDSVQQPTSTYSTGFAYPAVNTVPQVAQSTSLENHFSMMPYNFPSLYHDPQMVTQMIEMQQMYAQYMIQYWQNISAAMNANITGSAALPNQAIPEGVNNVVAEVLPQQQAVQRVNAREDDEANFDWFEFLLQHCRFLVLFGIMYFYSSPEKLFIVGSFLIFTALYREGWLFRETIEELLNRLQNWVNQGAVNAPINNEDNQAQPINEEAQGGHEIEAVMDGDNPPHVQNPDVINNNNQQNSFLSIIAAFFFSLVPEAPPPVNLN